MKRVLVIGPSFYCYNYSIGDAFEKLGYAVQIVEFDEPVNPFNLRNRILNKLPFSRKFIQNSSRVFFNSSILKRFADFNPELVFIYNGDILEPSTISFFKQTAKVSIWALDGVSRHPRSEQLAPLVNAYFCFEQNDVYSLKSKGINVYFLPQACDTKIYHPIPSIKDIDILFVGALYDYPNRIKLLKKVVDTFPQYKIAVYGIYKPWYKNPLKWLFREKRDIFKNYSIPPEEVNRLYNRSKICLNIHHPQSKNGANPKVFEISGAGAFQLVDWNPFIESIFPSQEIAMYRSEKELIDMIVYYLHQDNTVMIEKAYKLISEKHTFVNRMSYVLKILGIAE